MIRVLEERDFPVSELLPLASSRSLGKTRGVPRQAHPGDRRGHVRFRARADRPVLGGRRSVARVRAQGRGRRLHRHRQHLASSATRTTFRWWCPRSIRRPSREYKKRGIIANPNCSTIQMVVALKPIHDAVGITRINVATYQSVSGAGKEAVDELAAQTTALMSGEQPAKPKVIAKRIAFNCVPQIDKFMDNGYTKEEMKMVWETQKILGDKTILVNATAVRVPVFFGHSEAVHIETRQKITAEAARELLQKCPGNRGVRRAEARRVSHGSHRSREPGHGLCRTH